MDHKKTAYQMGVEASKNGLIDAPFANAEFMKWMEPLSTGFGSTIPLMKSYVKGWTITHLSK